MTTQPSSGATKNDQGKELVSTAVLAVVLRLASASLSFLLSAAVARVLGAQGAGLYFLALSITMFATVVAQLGFEGTILRFVSADAAKEAWSEMRGVVRYIVRLITLVSGSIGLLIFLLAWPISTTFFDKPNLAGPLRWMALAILMMCLMRLTGQALKGLKHVAHAETAAGLTQPALALLFLYPLINIFGVEGAAMAFFVSSVTAAALGLIFWMHKAPAIEGRPELADRRLLFESSRPLWFSSIVNQAALPWVPVILLGLWSTVAEAGIYAIAARLANLVSIFLTGVNTVLAPRFSQLHVAGRTQEIGPVARKFAILTTMSTLPIFVVLILFANFVMGLFGTEFRAGAAVLVILTLGQLVAMLTGSVRFILIMTGNERAVRNATVVSISTLIVLALLLIPNHGALGAAIASSVATAVSNLLPVFFVWEKYGIMTIPGLHVIFNDKEPSP